MSDKINPGDLVELYDVNYGMRTIGTATASSFAGYYGTHTILVGNTRFRSEGRLSKIERA